MTEQEIKVIGWARSRQFMANEILAFYDNNVKANSSAPVLAAIRTRMRVDFPKAATRRFGAKEQDFVEILSRIVVTAAQDFVLDDNRVGAHVKTGGDEISGRVFLWRYLSYKNAGNQGAAIALVQEQPDSEAMVLVSRYQTHAGEANFNDLSRFALGEVDEAEQLYRSHLQAIARDPAA